MKIKEPFCRHFTFLRKIDNCNPYGDMDFLNFVYNIFEQNFGVFRKFA